MWVWSGHVSFVRGVVRLCVSVLALVFLVTMLYCMWQSHVHVEIKHYSVLFFNCISVVVRSTKLSLRAGLIHAV